MSRKQSTEWDYTEDFKGRDCKEQARKIARRYILATGCQVKIELTEFGCRLLVKHKTNTLLTTDIPLIKSKQS